MPSATLGHLCLQSTAMRIHEIVDPSAKPIYYLEDMSNTNNNMDDLEKQVEELLNLCDKLTQSNSTLRGTVNELTTERSGLIQQKDKARNHIESMITRLKSMEENP